MAEIKDNGWATEAEGQFKADEKMCQWYNYMLPNCCLPRLWGLSLLGTSLHVYCGGVATDEVEPALKTHPSPTRTLPPKFLEGAWNIDILSQEGFTKMKEIVGDILDNVAAL